MKTESQNQASNSMQGIQSTKETEDPSTNNPRGSQRLHKKKESARRITKNRQNVQDLKKRSNTLSNQNI